MRELIKSFVAIAALVMASSTWAGLVTFPLAVDDIEIDNSLPPDQGLVLRSITNQIDEQTVTSVERLIPVGETPSAILLSQFLTDVSYAGFFDTATIAGQTIPGAFGLERFFLGSTDTVVNEIFGARTSNAIIIPDMANIISAPDLATVLAGTLQFDDVTTVTTTSFFLDVNTIAQMDMPPTDVPEPSTLGLLLLGFVGLLARRRLAR